MGLETSNGFLIFDWRRHRHFKSINGEMALFQLVKLLFLFF